MGHAKAINRTEVAQGATNVRSQVIPISALVKATNRSPRRKDRLIVVSFLFAQRQSRPLG